MGTSLAKRLSIVLTLSIIAPLLLRFGFAQNKAPSIPGDPRPACVIIVCDASGSMLAKINSAKKGISSQIRDLRERQRFNIIFFSGPDDPLRAFSADIPMRATDQNKKSAEEFVAAITTGGETAPLRALTLAFKQKPQVLYFLSDGEFDNFDAVAQAIAKANPDHATTVNTIGFFNDEDRKHNLSDRFAKMLQRIAGDNGGKYKEVNSDQN